MFLAIVQAAQPWSWQFIFALLSGAGITVVVYAVVLPFRIGGLKQQFQYHTELVKKHDDQIQHISQQVVDIRLIIARELRKTNGG